VSLPLFLFSISSLTRASCFSVGMFWLSLWTLVDGFAKSEIQLIVFRAMVSYGKLFSHSYTLLILMPHPLFSSSSARTRCGCHCTVLSRNNFRFLPGQGEELRSRNLRCLWCPWLRRRVDLRRNPHNCSRVAMGREFKISLSESLMSKLTRPLSSSCFQFWLTVRPDRSRCFP